MTSESDTDFGAASTAKRLVEAEAQLKFYRDREEHFARVLAVSDGGQYRADWDSRIKAIIAERDRAIGDAKRLEHELREVVRAFEKFGEANALADANGNITPYLGVLRVLERLHEAERDAFQLGLLFARVCGQVQNKLPYISATLAPGNRRALTYDMCSIDGARANQSYVFLQELSKIVSKAVEEAKTGAEKNETRDDTR